MTFDDLLLEHVFSSFDKQLTILDVHSDDDIWAFSLETGLLTLGGTVDYPAQILGTESHLSETWRWAWANEASQIPEALLAATRDLRSFGEANRLDELTTADLSLDDADGDVFGLFALGILGKQAYYSCPYEGGRMIVLLDDPRLQRQRDAKNPLLRALDAIPQAISTFEFPTHRPSFESYLRQCGVPFDIQGETLSAEHAGITLGATFDDQGRLTDLDVDRPDGGP
ncbi:MAG: DUF6882 domain-containing protein [Acidobacteriota bacterium]